MEPDNLSKEEIQLICNVYAEGKQIEKYVMQPDYLNTVAQNKYTNQTAFNRSTASMEALDKFKESNPEAFDILKNESIQLICNVYDEGKLSAHKGFGILCPYDEGSTLAIAYQHGVHMYEVIKGEYK